jgi:hypothetical protein
MLYFTTLFDINYLSRALAMINSLNKYSSSPTMFFVLAMDTEVEKYFEQNKYPNLQVIPLLALENYFPELNRLKKDRSKSEYCFTLSPFYPIYILEQHPEIDKITSMDADLLFFDDVNLIFNTYQDKDVLITPHNFSTENLPAIKVGVYNVSFQSFRNNENGLAVLNDWKYKCTEWCKDEYDERNERYADQKYLDLWKEKFNGVQSIENIGAGIAPWNISKSDLKLINNKFYCGKSPLIFYHFQSFRIYNSFMCQHALNTFRVGKLHPSIKKLYKNYFHALLSIKKDGFDLKSGKI